MRSDFPAEASPTATDPFLLTKSGYFFGGETPLDGLGTLLHVEGLFIADADDQRTSLVAGQLDLTSFNGCIKVEGNIQTGCLRCRRQHRPPRLAPGHHRRNGRLRSFPKRRTLPGEFRPAQLEAATL